MRCYSRGVGAGRWVWGNFLARQYDSPAVVGLVHRLLDTEQSINAHVPGLGKQTFLCATQSDGHRKYSVRLSENALRRLSWRYLNANAYTDASDVPCREEVVIDLRRAILHAMSANSALCRTDGAANSWTITPSFYEMAAILVDASCELFSDAVNESGVLGKICSLSADDASFGSCGSWESVDEYVLAGAAGPCGGFPAEILRLKKTSYLVLYILAMRECPRVGLTAVYCFFLRPRSTESLKGVTMAKDLSFYTYLPTTLALKGRVPFFTTTRALDFHTPCETKASSCVYGRTLHTSASMWHQET